MSNDAAEVKKSFGRCIIKKDFLPRFYDIFLESHPSVKPKFANTKFENQVKLLRQGLNMLIMFSGGNKVAGNALDRLRESHNRTNLNINPELYSFWLESLVKTLYEFDPKMDTALEASWRKTMQKGIDHLAEGY